MTIYDLRFEKFGSLRSRGAKPGWRLCYKKKAASEISLREYGQ